MIGHNSFVLTVLPKLKEGAEGGYDPRIPKNEMSNPKAQSNSHGYWGKHDHKIPKFEM